MCFPFQTCNTKKNILHSIPWAIFPFCWSRCAWVYRQPSAACSVALILYGNYSFHLHSAFNTGRWTTHICVPTLCLVHYGYLNKIFLWISEFIREIFVNCLYRNSYKHNIYHKQKRKLFGHFYGAPCYNQLYRTYRHIQ